MVAEKECSLDKNRWLVVGVSGGADSLCLLHTLHDLGYRIVAAHFDHQLRPSSKVDAFRVAEIATRIGVPFALGSAEVAGFAAQNHLSIEEAARKLRYHFLFETAHGYQAQAVAVGHTADDQVETVLMHLLRGSGLAGLKGMLHSSVNFEWDPALPVVRPLLDVWRTDTHAYCAGNGLEPIEDASNLDTTYFRNRLRIELIPFLESYNPQFRRGVLRMSRTLGGDYMVIETALDLAWKDCILAEERDYVIFRRDKFLSLLPGMQRGLLRRAAVRLQPKELDFELETIERALAWVASLPRQRQVNLAGKLRINVEEEQFILFLEGAILPGQDWPQLPAGFSAELPFPGELRLLPARDWLISAQLETSPVESKTLFMVDKPRSSQPNHSGKFNFEAWLDLDTLSLPLVVRRHRSGERWQPLGMQKGSIKLSDFFTNVKLPRTARAGWPVVCSGDAIAWIPGFRPGQAYKVQDSTARILHLTMRRD